MPFPALASDITKLLDRLEELPKLGKPLRDKPHLRKTLFELGEESAQRFGTPRSEVERMFRAELRELAGLN